MRYIFGAGISGLLWGFYHPEYQIFTDRLGTVVTGAESLVWLNYTPLTDQLLLDLGMWPGNVVVKPIGYKMRVDSGFVVLFYEDAVRTGQMENVFLKKMVPWEALDSARAAGIEIKVSVPSRTITKDGSVLHYLDVDMREVADRLLARVRSRLREGVAVCGISRDTFETINEGTYDYQHIVSTLPAPVFVRLWDDEDCPWRPRLHYCPVTCVVSKRAPAWWDDRFVVVYDADPDSPVSRVGRFGDTWRYEFTGRPDDDTLSDYLPVENGRFVNPYGRITQDVKLESPDPKIQFLGRAAEWDYRGLIDRTLEKVRGLR